MPSKNKTVWKPIEKHPKYKAKGKLYIYRFKPSEKEHARSLYLPEFYSMDRIRGSRVCTHYAVIDAYTGEEENESA